MNNIIEWVLENKYARNEYQAAHIANGLRLAELHNDPEAQQTRVKLYRAWRDSQVFPKDDTASCYAKAIQGERVPELPLMMSEAEAGAIEAVRRDLQEATFKQYYKAD